MLLLFAGLTTLVLVRCLVQPDAWVSGEGDEVLEEWFLGWVPWAITHGHNPLVTPLIDHPAGVNLMWNTSLPLLGLLGAPIEWLLGPRVEYHVWLTVGITLSGFFAYLFVSRRTRLVPAIICGVIYAFSPFMAFQATGHLHEAFAAGPPLLLLLFDDLLVRRTRSMRRTGVYVGLVVAAQLLISEEVLASELVMAPVLLAILAYTSRGTPGANVIGGLRRLAGILAVAGPVALLIVAYPLIVQFLGPQRISGPAQTSDYFVTDLLNVVVPNGQWLTTGGGLRIAAGFYPESRSYISVPGLLLLGGIMFGLRRQRAARWASLGMAAAFVLSLGAHVQFDNQHASPALPLPGAVLDHIPLLDSLLPGRLSMYTFLFAGVLVALGLDAAWGLLPTRVLPVVTTAGMTAITLVALTPPLPLSALPHSVPAYFNRAVLTGVPDGSTVLVAPWQTGTYPTGVGSDVGPLLWQEVAAYRFAMPSGYAIVPGPDGRARLVAPGQDVAAELVRTWFTGQGLDPTDPSVRASTLQTLRGWHLSAIVLGPMPHRDVVVRFFATLLGRPPISTGGVELWTGPFG